MFIGSVFAVSNDTLWHWVQQFGRQAMHQLDGELEPLATGIEPGIEPLAPVLAALPWVIAADGVSVPFARMRVRLKAKFAFGKSRSPCLPVSNRFKLEAESG
jgi:hypothetical protein